MREVLLLWGFSVLALVVLAVVVMLALGVVFGVVWLAWKTIVFLLESLDSFISREPVRFGKGERDGAIRERPDNPRVPRRLWFAGRQPVVGVQGGLVPASPCVARGGVARLERRGSAGSCPRRD